MRTSFDKLISWTALLLAAFLLVAGGLLTFAYFYIGNEVKTQLSMQDITMPEGAALQSLPPDDQAALKPYAGSPMDTGPEAKAYADHYILVHMNEASGGKTYSEVSGQYIQQCTADPKAAATQACQDLSSLRQTLFMGDTLRGLLLYGAAFATIGTIAGYGAIVAFAGAIGLVLLAGLGFWHSRRADTTVAADSQAGAHV
jgi:hypothetical protein